LFFGRICPLTGSGHTANQGIDHENIDKPTLAALAGFSVANCSARSDLGFSNTAKMEMSQQVNWLSYAEAMSEGRTRDQKIILFFTVDGDQWCSKMENETFANSRLIAYLNNNFVIGKIDRNRFPSVARRYKVDAMPTLWFLDSQGKGLTSTDGFMPPRQMLLLLEFINSELYKETTFKNWKEGGRSRR